MDKEYLTDIDKYLKSYAETYMPLMELNNAVIGAMTHLSKDFFSNKVNAMRDSGMSADEIQSAIEQYKQLENDRAMQLGRDTFKKMASAIAVIRPVFSSLSSDPLIRVYNKLEERLNSASKIIEASGTTGELLLIHELLVEMCHELRIVIKWVRANLEKEIASPLAQQVRVAVKFSDDLSFLNERSWPKRVDALRQHERERFAGLSEERQKLDPNRGELKAGDRYITNILKGIPKVREYLKLDPK